MINLGNRIRKGAISAYFWLSLILFVAIFLWSSNLLTLLNPSFDKFVLKIVSSSTESSIGSLLSTISAILATILAISFSISIIVVQNAASTYTASILDMYKKDQRTLFFFFYYVLSLILSIVALQSQNLYLVNMTIVMFLFAFLFLLLQFVHIVDLIDPRNIIEKAKQEAIKNIKRIPSDIQSIIKHEKTPTKIEKDIVGSPIYSHFLLHYDKSLLAFSRQKVLQISDVAIKASSRREIETSVKGFEALSEIARSYVSIRKEDPATQDSFLEYIYNELLSIFTIGFNNKDIALMQEVIKTLENIGCSAADIVSMGNGPNLSAVLVMKHINDLGIMALEEDFTDVSAQAINSIKILGLVTIRKTGGGGLAPDYIHEIGKKGVQKESWFIIGSALSGLKELLWQAIEKQIDVNSEPATVLKNISELSVLSISNDLDKNSITTLFPIFPEYSILRAAVIALQVKNETHPEIQTYQREQYSKEILNLLIETLGEIEVSSAKKHSTFTLWQSNSCLRDIALLMLKEKLLTIKDGYRTETLSIIEGMKVSYLILAGYAFDNNWHVIIPSQIVDSITSIATFALDSQKEVTEECITALHEMGIRMIKRDKYGYDVARLAARIGIIGIVALNKNENPSANQAGDLLASFDEVYLRDSPGPHEGRIIEEIRQLYENCKTGHLAMQESEVYCASFKIVETKNIDDFIKLYEQKRKQKPS